MVKKEFQKVESQDLVILQRYIKVLWDFLPLPLCDINGALIIINVGKKFLEFFGYSEEEIVGESIKKIFASFDEFKRFRKELEKEEIFQKEFNLSTKDKQIIPAFVFAKARKEEQMIISYFVAFIDLRELKERERKLQEKIEELEIFHRLAVGRELKMLELKEEIARLKKIKGQKR